MDTQLKRGVLDACVLSALLSADSYGYQIIKDISPYMTISESTLYPILRRLESGGYLDTIEEFLTEWESIMELYSYIKGEYEREQA